MHPLQGAGRAVQRRTLVLLGAVFGADQAAKLVVAARLPLGHSVPVVPGVLAFTHTQNRGVAFGLLDGVSPLVPAAVTLTLLLLLFYNKARWIRRPTIQAAFAMLGGGAVSNLVDRLRVGAVVDFIDVYRWPVFNLADAAVSVGALLLALTLLRGER